jgi:hypothetical protein
MMSCDSFRARFAPATEDPALLEHVRTCDRCLDFAADVDPDVMFRALGGSEMIPPGGVDAFVDDVMRQVRVRQAETAVETRPTLSWTRRLAMAASITVAVTAGTMAYRYGHVPVAAPAQMAHQKILTTKPVVETYDSDKATIVEVPAEGAADDVKIVMIFDENLPKDL